VSRKIHSLWRHDTGHTEDGFRCPRRDNLHATTQATGMTTKPRRFGDLEGVSGCRRRAVSRRVVTWCDEQAHLTLGFR
jgi:hypothetical protein